jgi:DNA-binding response OmpR family regulator
VRYINALTFYIRKRHAEMSALPLHYARVLVVDDDDEVRGLIGSMLTEAGFIVSTAPTALSALELLDKDEFDVMVTDVALPDALDGVELVKFARARHPALRSLFISGRRGPIVDEPERDDFVGKPFRSGELLGCVLELLYRGLPKKKISSPSRELELATIEAKLARFQDEHRDGEAGDFIAMPTGREPRGRP